MSKVLVVSAASVAGGAERVMTALADGLIRRGHDVRGVLFTAGPFGTWLDEVGCPYDIVGTARYRNPVATLRLMARLRERIASFGADVVLVNGSRTHFFAGWPARTLSTPVVWVQPVIPGPAPGGGPRTSDPRVEWLASHTRASAVVVASRVVADAQQVLTPTMTADEVPPGIDLPAVRSSRGAGRNIRDELGWGDDLVVGTVGRVHPWKGQEQFVRAAAMAAEALPDVRFVLLGGLQNSDFVARLGALIADIGPARLEILGERADPHAVIDAMDLVVHAAPAEGFGLVVVEAMALGKPVIGVNVGGPSEIITDGADGVLVSAGDPAALADAIVALAGDPQRRARLGAAAMNRADDFSHERMVDGYVDVIDRVLAT